MSASLVSLRKLTITTLVTALLLIFISPFAPSAHADELTTSDNTISLPKVIYPAITSDTISLTNSGNLTVTPFSNTGGSDGELTDWILLVKQRWSKNIGKFTLTTLTSYLVKAFPESPYTWCAQIAADAYGVFGGNLYYSTDQYYKYIRGTKLIRASKVVSRVYSNSSRTHQIGSTHTSTNYSPGYPNN